MTRAPAPVISRRCSLVFAGLAVTLAGTAWSGWLGLREPRPRGFWSRVLLALGIVMCLVEVLWILVVLLGIGAA